jgi:competence protein ComEC
MKKRKSKRRRGHTGRNTCIVVALLAAFGLYYYHQSETTVSLDAALSWMKGGQGEITKVSSALAENEIRVHFIDLGQADAILIQSRDNAVLIDGGDNATRETLVSYIRDAGVAVLDYIVATHPHVYTGYRKRNE